MSAAVSIGNASRFEIERCLGAGGMGVVYLARDRERRMRVALKTLKGPSALEVARLKREFRALADVAHPGLVELYELFAEGGQWFFTMEAIEGVPFDAWCARVPSPGERDELVATRSFSRSHVTLARAHRDATHAYDDADAFEIGAQPVADLGRLDAALAKLTDAIDALHDAGKLHCDLKPSNVLVTSEGRVVVLDFGLVRDRPRGASDEVDALEGTPAYLAPELASSVAPSAAADWYGVGVMLFQAITGVLPFDGHFAQVLAHKLLEDAPRASERVHGVPPELDALVAGLLVRDPAKRLGAAAIRNYLSGESASIAQGPLDAPEPPFFGRDVELAQLRALFEAAAAGAPQFALVRGPSGMGKSALVRHFTRELAERGEALVLVGRCYEREDVPFKALDSIVDALTSHLARLPTTRASEVIPETAGALAVLFPVLLAVDAIAALPVPDALDPSAVRALAAEAARDLFARLGALKPIVFAVDDLQWGDLDSAAFLAELINPGSVTPVLFVASVRSETAESEVVRAIREHARRVTLIELPPLGDEACLRLAQSALGEHGARAREIATEAHGSPFFALELSRHLERGGPAGRVLGTVDEVVRARLADVPAPARAILELSALAGVPVPVRVIERAAGLTSDPFVQLRWLGAHSLVRSNVQREVEPYHDRIREVVVASLGDRRVALHAQLGDALADEPGADPEAVAHHLAEGGDAHRALSFQLRAAERASAALAFDHAVVLYRRALAFADTAAIRERLAEALVLTGRASEAAPMFASCAREAATPEGASRLWRRAAEEWLKCGRIDEGVAMLRQVLAGVGLRYPDSQAEATARALMRILRVRMLEPTWTDRAERDVPASVLARVDAARAAGVGLMLVDPLRGYGFLARFLLDAKSAGEPRRIAAGLSLNAVTLTRGGEAGYPKAKRFLAASRVVAERFDDDYLRGLADACEAGISVCTGRWRIGAELGLGAPRLLRRSGTPATWESTVSGSLARTALYFSGSLAELRVLTGKQLRAADDVGDLFAATYARVHGWFVAAMDDGIAQGRAALEHALDRWSHLGFHAMHLWALYGQLQYDRYAGENARGIERIDAARPALERSRILAMQFYRVFLTASEALLRVDAGGTDNLRAAERCIRTLEKEGPEYASALGLLARAKLDHAGGATERARTRARQAALGFDRAEMRLHAAAARSLGARWSGAIESHDEAVALVRAEGVRAPERWLAMLA